ERVSGLLVEPGDEEALARAIRDVLVDGDLAARLEEGGRRRAEQRFDIKRNVAVMHGWLGNGRTGTGSTGEPLPYGCGADVAERASRHTETTVGEVS
ncbi:MAG: hypothetical protein IIB60_02325, partial [Planctomycetes bacterium]|nr:hypothetical protein [Planctomycetota bacterium]